jgi:hypothetical protein
MGLARELTRLGSALETAGRNATAPAPPAEPAAAAPRPAPAAPARLPEPAPGRASAAAAAFSPADLERETGDLAGSLLRYHRLVATFGVGASSLEELLAGPPVDPAVRPRAAAPVFEMSEPAGEPPAAPTVEPVPITSLCYSGPEALRRALGLRGELRDLVSQGAPAGAVTELAEEIFDLVQLGLDGGR